MKLVKMQMVDNKGQSTAELKDFQMDPERKSLPAHYHYEHIFPSLPSLMA